MPNLLRKNFRIEVVCVATLLALLIFVGSIFFTSAALLQYLEVANTSRVLPGQAVQERRRLLTWEPHRIEWWAVLVQLAGTRRHRL